MQLIGVSIYENIRIMNLGIAVTIILVTTCVSKLVYKTRESTKRKTSFANKYLYKQNGEWFLRGRFNKSLMLSKIVAQSRRDLTGRVWAVTGNSQAHMFINPRPDFLEYLSKLPYSINPKLLKFNGTDFLIRKRPSVRWQEIGFHGIASQYEETLHLFDKMGKWYKFANEPKLRAYLSCKPKTVALADNLYLDVTKEGNWVVKNSMNSSLVKPITSIKTYVVHVGCAYKREFVTLSNPPIEFIQYCNKLPSVVWDPYNFTIVDSQTYMPKLNFSSL